MGIITDTRFLIGVGVGVVLVMFVVPMVRGKVGGGSNGG